PIEPGLFLYRGFDGPVRKFYSSAARNQPRIPRSTGRAERLSRPERIGPLQIVFCDSVSYISAAVLVERASPPARTPFRFFPFPATARFARAGFPLFRPRQGKPLFERPISTPGG